MTEIYFYFFWLALVNILHSRLCFFSIETYVRFAQINRPPYNSISFSSFRFFSFFFPLCVCELIIFLRSLETIGQKGNVATKKEN